MPASYRGEFTTHTYDGALAFIMKGKSKRTRKVRSNTYLAVVDDSTIALVLHHTSVVVYHKGTDEVDIYTGGWDTVTTRDRIHTFSPARIGKHKGELSIHHASDERTPVRKRKCSACGGGGQSPRFCYVGWEHVDGTYQRRTCAHGLAESHRDGLRNCDRCGGEGRMNIGGVGIPTPWTGGNAARVDGSGKYLGPTTPTPAPVYVGAPAKSSTYYASPWGAASPSYASSPVVTTTEPTLSLLRSIVPDLGVVVPDPTGTDHYGGPATVENMVIRLNDNHGWSREQVADWLDTLSLDLRLTS